MKKSAFVLIALWLGVASAAPSVFFLEKEGDRFEGRAPASVFSSFLAYTNAKGKTPASLLGLAWANVSNGNFSEAKEQLDSFLTTYPRVGETSRVELLMAYVRLGLGQRKEAKQDADLFVRTRRFDPLVSHALLLSGRLALEVDAAEEAIGTLSTYWSNQAVRTQPESAGALADLGEAWRRSGQEGFARSNLMLGLKLFPRSPEVGRSTWRLALLDKPVSPVVAQAAFEGILTNAATAPWSYLALRELLALSLSQKKESVANDYRRLILSDYPKAPEAAAIKAELDRQAAALAAEQARKAIEAGKAAVREGRIDEGVAALQSVLKGQDRAAKLEVLNLLIDATRDKNPTRWLEYGRALLKDFPEDPRVGRLLPDMLDRAYRGKDLDTAVDLARQLAGGKGVDDETRREAARYLILIFENEKKDLSAAQGAYETWFATKPPRSLERLAVLRDYLALLTALGKKDQLVNAWQDLYADARTASEKSKAARELALLVGAKDARRASKLMEEAASTRPDAREALDSWIQAMTFAVKGGDGKRAGKLAETILLFYPDRKPGPSVYLALGQAYASTGKKSEAKAAFDKVKKDWPDSAEAKTAAQESDR